MRDGKSNDLEHVAFIIGKCASKEGGMEEGGRNTFSGIKDELKKDVLG